MALSKRDRERLEQLARQLPEPLAKPTPAPAAAPPQPTGHRIERETDPEALFQALMQASPDGQVPPHWLARLRELEQQRPQGASPARSSKPVVSKRSGRSSKPAPGDQELYTAFEQLLLEDEEL